MLTYGFNLVVNPCAEFALIDINKEILENRDYDMPIFMACGMFEDKIKFVVLSLEVPITAVEVEGVLKNLFQNDIAKPVCIEDFCEIIISDYKKMVFAAPVGKILPSGFNSLTKMLAPIFMKQSLSAVKGEFKFTELLPTTNLIQTEKNISSKSFAEELNRIFDSSNVREFIEHPLHYVIKAKNQESAKNIVSLLVSALYANNRLISRRVSWFSDMKKLNNDFKDLFEASLNSTVVFECPDDSDVYPSDLIFYAKYAVLPPKGSEIFPFINYLLQRNHQKTLFIFVDIGDNSSKTNQLIELVKNSVDLVTIYGE